MEEPLVGEMEVTAGGVVEKVFPPLDQTTLVPQVFWLGVVFVLLYFLLQRLIIPRVGKVLKERHDTLQGDLKTASRLKEEVDAAVKAYDKTLSTARANANTLGRKILDGVAADIQKERSQAEKQMAQKLLEGEKNISEAKQKALTRIQEMALEISQPILQQLLGKSFSQEDIQRAIPEKRNGV